MAAIAFPIYHRIHLQYRAISQTHTNIKIQCSRRGLVRRDLNTAWPSVRLCPVCITMIIILILIIIRSLIIIVIIVAGFVSSICSSKHSTINKEEPQRQPFWLSSVQHSSI